MPPRYSIRDSITNLRSPRATWDQQFASLTSLTSGAGRPTRSAWVQTALEHDPNCVSYILNHADPRKIMVFPGKEVIVFLFPVVFASPYVSYHPIVE